MAVATKSEMMSHLNNGYDIMNCFAKFEKFLPHSTIIPSFMSVRRQMPELDWGGGFLLPPPYKIGSQNTPYKSGLSYPWLATKDNLKTCSVVIMSNRDIQWFIQVSI